MVDQVVKSLQTYKSLEEGPATLEQRKNIMKQLMIDLTMFENIPPCAQIDKRECILARKSSLSLCHPVVTKVLLVSARRGVRVRDVPLSGEERHRGV